jgi:uncharacterized protein (TIGR03083 family)
VSDLGTDLETAYQTIEAAGSALVAAGRSAPDLRVPWCPDWTVASVVAHIGSVHEWVTGMVSTAASDRAPFPNPPELTGVDLADWADERRAQLLDALRAADPDRPMWAFGLTVPTRFWARRQTHETSVHAVDATAAAGQAWTIPGDVADDGLDEFLGLFVPFQWQRRPPEWGDGRSVAFRRTDGDGDRLLTIRAGPKLERTRGDADLTVTGTAHDLLLWTLNRPSAAKLSGDQYLASAWADNVRF